MATLEQETQERKKLEDVLNKIAEIEPDSLVRRAELGTELSFESGLPYFTRTLKLFRDLKNCSLDGASYTALNQLFNVATQALTEFENIRKFSIQQHPQNTIGARNQLIDRVRDSYDNYYQIITPHIAYSVRKGTDFEALEREARETLKNLQQTRDEMLRIQKTSQAESQEILESMRRAAAEAGVSQHAIYFKEEADSHKAEAEKWLGRTVKIAAATLLLALFTIVLYAAKIISLSSEEVIQVAIAKIVLFSILYFAMIWASKNYRSHQHNYVVNKHRQNGLSTFQAFVNATEDDTIKNAVLLKATEAIFSVGPSGFVSGDTEVSSPPQILEIVRGVVQRKTE
jgi:hypothetical protein